MVQSREALRGVESDEGVSSKRAAAERRWRAHVRGEIARRELHTCEA